MKISEAYELALNAHKGQVRRGGKDYFRNHVERVFLAASEDFESMIEGVDNHKSYQAYEDVMSVALLHDILEDTSVTVDNLREKGFNETVIEAVVAITKVKGESYQDYLERVRANKIARFVKIRDIKHNLYDQPSKRQIEKYLQALAFLL